jgi:dTDP-4-dehydrorhamnose 3,5-epimerase
VHLKYPKPILITPRVHGDARGYFFEPYNRNTYLSHWGIDEVFVQDNESLSAFGVLRGLHYQIGPFAQAKLVRVVLGKVLDVVVDIRADSPHFASVYEYVLDDEKHEQLFVPRGFAHGFAVLSDKAIFQYKVDNFYSREHERGILYRDPALGIDWRLEANELLTSAKDQTLPVLSETEPFALK